MNKNTHPNLYKIIEDHRNYELHKRNIKHISARSTFQQDPKRTFLLTHYKKQRQMSDKHLKSSKDQEVAKQNDQILERINRIYNRDKECNSARYRSEYKKSATSLPKNQQELERQNKRIASRIILCKSKLETQRELRAKYMEHVKHKMRLSHFANIKERPLDKHLITAEKFLTLEGQRSKSFGMKTKSTSRTHT